MDLLIANASEIGGLETFYRITDYGGSVVPSDRVVYATEEERIIGVGRLFEKEGVLVLRGIRVMKEHSGREVRNAILDSLVSEVGDQHC